MAVIPKKDTAQSVPFKDAVYGSRAAGSVAAAGEMGSLVLVVFRALLRPPYPWAREVVEQASIYARRMAIPMTLSLTAYLIGYAVFFFGGVTSQLGVGERLGGAVFIGVLREVGVWITTMVFAGVAGSAVAADLGARKIREELDALSVLGVSVVRTLVVPRILAMTLLAPLMGLIGVFVGTFVPYLVAPGKLGYSAEIYAYSVIHNVYATDVVAFALKLGIIGMFVGVVSCQKGLSCRGGAEGVGRAVTQTVVLTFFGVWLINSLFNLGYLTLFPETAVLRG